MEDLKKDPIRIARDEHDPVSKAKKVKLVSTEIAIELDHNDGDSVTSHPEKLVVKVEGVDAGDNASVIVPALDCSSLRQVRVDVDGSGSVKVMVSPEDSGSYFYELGAQGNILDVCARRIKIESVDAVGDVYLVGRS